MKKTILTLFAFAALTVQAQIAKNEVLLTIDGEPAYASEFLYIYNKNNADSAIENKTLDEYLDMFINYKLKVHEAKKLGLDTATSFKKELQGYRKQIVPPYLTDSAAELQQLQKAYQRSSEDVAVSHIAVICPMSATAEDTLAAFKKISEARQRVTTGIEKRVKRKIVVKPEEFKDVAAELSDDPTAKDNGGYLGWIVPFRYVSSFEDAAYNTKLGEVSQIFRTPFGYHILKVEQRIPHYEVRASHIMKMTPKGDNQKANDSIAQAAEKEIRAIYEEVTRAKDPVPFAQEAREKSDDRGTRENGGDLTWFGLGRMVPEFEKTAFALQDSGSISEPIRSQYGWHIIQKTGERKMRPFEEVKPELQRHLRRSENSKLIEQAFVDKQKAKYNFRADKSKLQPLYEIAAKHAISDSLFYQEASQLNDVLFTFADQKRTQADFAEFIKANNKTQLGIPDKIIDDKFHTFVNRELVAYEETQLEKEYPEFRNLMSEYHDGILLFNLALDKVWNRATTDTAGLREYFKANKKKYTFNAPKYKGRVLYCRDAVTLKAAKAIVKNATSDSINSYLNKRLNIDTVQSVKTEKGLWEAGQNKAVDKYGLKLKDADFQPSAEFPYVAVIGKKIKAPEEYSDVRGEVIADYQDFLEKQWVEELRAKYTVQVDQNVFDKIKAQK